MNFHKTILKINFFEKIDPKNKKIPLKITKSPKTCQKGSQIIFTVL